MPFGIMKIEVSRPAVWPTWASEPSPVIVFAFVTNWRSEPCPVSFVFTIVSKLKPKSKPLTVVPPPFTSTATAVIDSAVVVAVVRAASVVEPLAASINAGFSPPTRSVTATAAPVVPVVRKV